MSNKQNTLKVLHTSDWHLGRRLYGHTRYEEFAAFLDWLYNYISNQAIDILIIAGDIFDTMTPSNRAQTLYYEFLGRISHSSCQNVVIVAGNHDSPSLLDAPKFVLKFLNVHIIGTACKNISDEVITLRDNNNNPQAIILAVPYLRDKDIRHSTIAETSLDKNHQVIQGIQKHYEQATKIAKQEQERLNTIAEHPLNIPIIATGHLMAVDGKTTYDDGVRDLYVGSLGSISAEIFDPFIDYVALGHLHAPQSVGNHDHIRYSGSPIPMGFGEVGQQKQILLVEFNIQTHNLLDNSHTKNNYMSITPINVPSFQKLKQIKGNLSQIKTELQNLQKLKEPIWTEIIYESDELVGNLSQKLENLVKDSNIHIIKVKNTQTYRRILKQSEHDESLQELTKNEVFTRCLDANEISKNQQTHLIECFHQIIYEIEHDDQS